MIFSALVKLAALIVLLMLGGIIVSLIISSSPSIQKFGFAFCGPKSGMRLTRFGALVPIYGTTVTSFIALLIAVPVSFGIALFLTELSPHGSSVRWALRLSCWRQSRASCTACGACLFSPRCLRLTSVSRSATSRRPSRSSARCLPARLLVSVFSPLASFTAIMIIPYIAAVMRDVFEQTPVMMKESAYGIGCTTGGDLAHRFTVH